MSLQKNTKKNWTPRSLVCWVYQRGVAQYHFFSLLVCLEFMLNCLYVKVFIVRNESRESPIDILEPD